MGGGIRYVPEEISAALVNRQMAMEATAQAYMAVAASRASSFPVTLAHGSDAKNRFSVKPSASPDIAGLKVGSYWPGNAAKGRPNHNSCILLFDQETGRIDTIVEAGIANGFRTAAGDALAVSRLARADAGRLAIFGAGNQAAYECEAVMAERPIDTIFVVNRDPLRARRFADRFAARVQSIEVVDAIRACKEADIIVTATGSREPLFEDAWVQPGTHISCMGADAPGKQELPPALLERAELFCDSVAQSVAIGEFQHVAKRIELGVLTATNLGEVLLGEHAGRTRNDAITVFDSSGLSLQDLYLAQRLVAAAERRLLTPGAN